MGRDEYLVGFVAVFFGALITTFAVVRLDYRTGSFAVWGYTFVKAVFATLAGSIAYGAYLGFVSPGTGYLGPIVRGLAFGVGGYAVTRFPVIRQIQNSLDRRIRDTAQSDDQWQLHRRARRLARGYTPDCVIGVYERRLRDILEVDDVEVRKLTTSIEQVIDPVASRTIVMGGVIRKIKSDVVIRQGRDAFDSFISSLLRHSRLTRFGNRLRVMLRRETHLITDPNDIVA